MRRSKEQVKVEQPDETKLKATVTQASVVRTIQEPLSVDDGGASLTVDGSVTADVSDRAARDLGKVDIAGFDVQLPREGTYTNVAVSLAAAGSSTVYTPAAGKKAQVLGFFLYCDADVTWELRYATSGNVIAGLSLEGAVAMNLVALDPPEGAADEVVEVYASAAANVKGWICVVEA